MGSLASRKVWLINGFTPQYRKPSVSAMANLFVEKTYLCFSKEASVCSATVCYANFGVNCTKMRNILLKSVHSSDGHQCMCVIFCQMLFYYCSLIPNHLLPSYFVMVCILPGTSFLLHWLLSSALCISMAKAKGWQYPEHSICADKQMSSRSLK